MASFLIEPAKVAAVFRAPDLQAALFFAFFMLDDPPTCPVRYGDQFVFRFVVALVSYIVFMVWGTVYFLPAGLLAGNAFEAVRRAGVGSPEASARHGVDAGAPCLRAAASRPESHAIVGEEVEDRRCQYPGGGCKQVR